MPDGLYSPKCVEGGFSEVPHSPAPMLQVPAEHSVWFEVARRLCYGAPLKNSGRGFKEGEIKPLPESSFFTSAPGRTGATALA